MRRIEYWTVWGNFGVCSKHRTLAAAKREAKACEARGGMPHEIYEVRLVEPRTNHDEVNL